MWTYFDGASWVAETSINPRVTLGSSGLVMVTTKDVAADTWSGYVRNLYSESYWIPPIIILPR